MYAIVRTGGKQYRVEEGRSLDVERLPAEEGATVELGDVLLIAEDGSVTIGTPTIEGARVLAVVDQQGRGPKIIVFNYKNKVRTRKKQGHRQAFTRLTVQDILRPGQEAKAKPPRARRAKAGAEEAGPVAEAPEGVAEDVAAEAVAEAITEAPAVEEPRKPRTPAKEKQTPTKAKAAKEKLAAKPKAKAEKKKPKRPAAKKAPTKDEKKPPARRRILRRKKED